jgi:hypothetical protein
MSVYDLYQSYLNAQKQVAPEPSLGILDPRLLYPQNYQGDGDGPRGGGDFGNLDMSTAKDFYVDGDVVTGYKNLSSGLYQDISGLNIQNLGIRNLPGITGILDSMRTTAPKYPGYFDYYNASDLITNPRSFFNFFRQPTPQEIVQQRGLAKQNMAEARDITQRIQKQTPPTPQDIARGGGRDRGNIGSDGADYSRSAQTGAKGGFGYGL